jgi:anti-sigma B factor antagonist
MDELEAGMRSLITVDAAADGSGTAIVTITGELDLSTIDTLKDEVAPVLAGEPSRLIVDVAGLRFADSSAIALWVRWATTVGEFELREPPTFLRRVITVMGLGGKLGLKP